MNKPGASLTYQLVYFANIDGDIAVGTALLPLGPGVADAVYEDTGCNVPSDLADPAIDLSGLVHWIHDNQCSGVVWTFEVRPVDPSQAGGQPTAPAGSLVELVHTNDPHTLLRPGAIGWVRNRAPDRIDVVWVGGSALSLLLNEGDQVRRIDLTDVPDAELEDLAERVGWPDKEPLFAECVDRGLCEEPPLPHNQAATDHNDGDLSQTRPEERP